jgi:transposase
MAELLEMAAMPELSEAIEPLVRVGESMRIERKAQDRPLAALSRRDEVTRRLMTVPGIGPGDKAVPAGWIRRIVDARFAMQ